MENYVGQQLGNYRLTRLLGQGGFADVYLGEHIHLRTRAAIKVLQVHLAENNAEAFIQEARMVAHLVHPHIIRVLDFGVWQSVPFLVMDYAPGGTLRQRYLKGTPLPPATLFPYITQIATALQYAHANHLIHRDVKPENMLIGSNNEVLLSDFGLALISQQSNSRPKKDMSGTVTYMAPEQVQGRPRPSSDQYSLAVVVYEWLTATRPFQGSMVEIATQQVLSPPPSLRERVPTLSRSIEQVVLKALSKNPLQRFATVQDFADALHQACVYERQTTGFMPTGSASPAGQAGAFVRQTGAMHKLPPTPDQAVARQAPLEQGFPGNEFPLPATPFPGLPPLPDLPASASHMSVMLPPDPQFSGKHPAIFPRPGESVKLPTVQPRAGTPPMHAPQPPAGPYPRQPYPGHSLPGISELSAKHPAFVNQLSTPHRIPQVSSTPSNKAISQFSAAIEQGRAHSSIPSIHTSSKDVPDAVKPGFSSRTWMLITILLIILLLGGAVTGVFYVVQSHQQQTPAPLPTVSFTVEPAPTLAVTTSDYPPLMAPVINDPLTTNLLGWDQDTQCSFTQDAYHIVQAPGLSRSCYARSTDYQDFVYQVQMTFIKIGHNFSSGGIAFRGNPTNGSGYYIEIFESGKFSFIATQPNGGTRILAGYPQDTMSIPSFYTAPGKTNTIAVVAKNDTFTFYVNGQQAFAPVHDASFSHGMLGVFSSGGQGQTTTDVAFTNAELWRL